MKTLLLVDDDHDILDTLADVLSSMGYKVITKSDAKAALTLLREGTPVDLIITDYHMPGIDGLEFIILIKQMLPDVPAVLITGQGEIDPYVKSLSLGVFEYLTKPVTMKDLRRVVHAALAGNAEYARAPQGETLSPEH